MNGMGKRLGGFLFWALVLLLLPAGSAEALRVGGGKEPVRGNPRWPDGTLAMVSLPTRVSHWTWELVGLSSEVYQYRCSSTEEFNTALDTFSILVIPRHELEVYDGAATDQALDNGRIDWTLTIQDADPTRLENNPRLISVLAESPYYGQPVPPPKLSLYLGPGCPIAWGKVKLPKNVTVIDKRVANSPYKNSKGGVVRLSVKNMITSAPIAGATLELTSYTTANRSWRAVASGQTDRRGTVVIRDLPPGSCQLELRAPGFAPREIGTYRNYGRTYETYDTRLSPAAAIGGVVKDGDKPVAGAKVSPVAILGPDGSGYRMSGIEAQTDERGRFTLQGLPSGKVCLRPEKSGFLAVFSGELHAVPGPDVRLALGRAGIIRVKVKGLEKAAGKPVMVEIAPEGGTKVGTWGGSSICRPDGSCLFPNVPPDRYVIFAHTNPARAQGNVIAPEQPRVTLDFKRGEEKALELELK